MALYVTTNSQSINAQRFLSKSTSSLNSNYRNLSSGLRINSARDDASGLQISDRLTSQIKGLEQGNLNALNGISMLQVAEGALDEITNNLQRIRVLAIQSANGSNSDQERLAIQEEVAQLSAEINRIAADTHFGGKKILNGEHDYKVTQETSMQDQFITVRPTMVFPAGADHAAQGVIDKYHESHTYSFQIGADAYQTVDVAMGIKFTGNLVHYDENGNFMCNYSAYGSNVDTFLGFDLNGLYLTSGSPNTQNTRVVGNDEALSQHTTGFTLGSDQKVSFDVSTFDAAESVIKYAGQFISVIDGCRAQMGAAQNRLESAINNQENVIENAGDARSRIRDCDYAAEIAIMTQNSIMQQSSTAILTQANTLPEIALNLLNIQ